MTLGENYENMKNKHVIEQNSKQWVLKHGNALNKALDGFWGSECQGKEIK